jgi:hypothetical protein
MKSILSWDVTVRVAFKIFLLFTSVILLLAYHRWENYIDDKQQNIIIINQSLIIII